MDGGVPWGGYGYLRGGAMMGGGALFEGGSLWVVKRGGQ